MKSPYRLDSIINITLVMSVGYSGSTVYVLCILKILLFGILFYRKKLLNYNVSLAESNFSLITVNVCPKCNSRTIKKRKKGYYCGKCRITFTQPALKHVEDNRNNLPIPLFLRGKGITK